jgi:hypothetical protein
MASLYERFLTVFGDIKVFPWPLFLLYQPKGYQVRGEDVREVIERIQPGDILLRGHKSYLDGYFIPGYFSHAGLYLGEVTEQDRRYVSEAGSGQHRDGRRLFVTGKQIVVHALAEGVLMEDVIQFCRCDYMAILRFPSEIRASNRGWKGLIPDDEFSAEERAIAERLRRGDRVKFSEAFPAIRQAALASVGKLYDFRFNFKRFERLSCSELAYFATKCLGPFLDITVEDKTFLLVVKRSVIEPDAFARSPLELAWKSRAAKEREIQKLKAAPAAG